MTKDFMDSHKSLIADYPPTDYVAVVGTSIEAIAYLGMTGRLITGDALRETISGGRIDPKLKKNPAHVYFETRPSAYIEKYVDLKLENPGDFTIKVANPDKFDEKYLDGWQLGISNAQEQSVWDYLKRRLGIELDYNNSEKEKYFGLEEIVRYIDGIKNEKPGLDRFRFGLVADIAKTCYDEGLNICRFSDVEKAFDAAVNLRGVLIYLKESFKAEPTRPLEPRGARHDQPGTLAQVSYPAEPFYPIYDRYDIQGMSTEHEQDQVVEDIEGIKKEHIAGIRFLSDNDLKNFQEIISNR